MSSAPNKTMPSDKKKLFQEDNDSRHAAKARQKRFEDNKLDVLESQILLTATEF